MEFQTLFVINHICPVNKERHYIEEVQTNINSPSYKTIHYIESVKLTDNIYLAKRFERYEDASFIIELLVLNGIYQIEKIFISQKETEYLKTKILK